MDVVDIIEGAMVMRSEHGIMFVVVTEELEDTQTLVWVREDETALLPPADRDDVVSWWERDLRAWRDSGGRWRFVPARARSGREVTPAICDVMHTDDVPAYVKCLGMWVEEHVAADAEDIVRRLRVEVGAVGARDVLPAVPPSTPWTPWLDGDRIAMWAPNATTRWRPWHDASPYADCVRISGGQIEVR